MNWLIQAALGRRRTVVVGMLTLVVLGVLAMSMIPIDILPVYNKAGVIVLTFYSGMPPADVGGAITNPMERMTGTTGGMERQESRSILGASIIRNYFHQGVDPNGALAQVSSFAFSEVPNLPIGALPPVVLPFDPTGAVPACIVAVDSQTQGQSVLYDVGRYEVRNMIMNSPGANAPVVFGGKMRTILAYLDPTKLQARGLSPMDVMKAIENYNLFLPTGDAKFGRFDYAIDSNSMYKVIDRMADIPLRVGRDHVDFLGDVAEPKDTSLIQMSEVRINGRKEVYIPIYRQAGASTLRVVDNLKDRLPSMPPRLSRPGIDLKLVMDQAIYVRQSIKSLITEGVLGAFLCSLVVLIFLGEWRMTVIAVMMIPLAVLGAMIGLFYTGNTVNIMTLGGLALAIGRLVDEAIVCLENTYRHMEEEHSLPQAAALAGTSEVMMPDLVASLSTLIVLAPLAFMPGKGQFLFGPMFAAVSFEMLAAFLLAMTFVPSSCGVWLKAPSHSSSPQPERQEGWIGRLRASGRRIFGGTVGRVFRWIQAGIDAGIRWYTRRLDWAMRHRVPTVALAVALLVVVVATIPILRRDFFPAVDAGSFEMYVRAESGTRIEITDEKIARVEEAVRRTIGDDLEMIISEIGVNADWSAAFTPNAGPMDTVVRIQLKSERSHSAQEYAEMLRMRLPQEPDLGTLEYAFDTGGMIHSAINEGQSTPIMIRIEGKNTKKSHEIARLIRQQVTQIDGVVDARIIQRLDYPEYIIDVDRAMSRNLGLTQEEIMKSVVAAIKSSVQFNKRNFWIDPVSENQYYVGVQYPEADIQSLSTLLNISITSPVQQEPIPLSNLVKIRPATMATEVTHTNLQTTTDLTMGVQGRDLGHVADDILKVVDQFGEPLGGSKWAPYDPSSSQHEIIAGSSISMSGEFGNMQEMFRNFGIGLLLAIVFVYFLMVVLLDSYLVPLVVLAAVPVSLVGIIPMLYATGTAINVQSLLGVIFTVGIVVANTVLLTDFAENIRKAERLSPTEAITKAAGIRARPVVMTAIAALVALVPMALAVERGSEANAPLGRAVIGGLLASLVATLVVVPALYSLVVPDDRVSPNSGLTEAAEHPAN